MSDKKRNSSKDLDGDGKKRNSKKKAKVPSIRESRRMDSFEEEQLFREHYSPPPDLVNYLADNQDLVMDSPLPSIMRTRLSSRSLTNRSGETEQSSSDSFDSSRSDYNSSSDIPRRKSESEKEEEEKKSEKRKKKKVEEESEESKEETEEDVVDSPISDINSEEEEDVPGLGHLTFNERGNKFNGIQRLCLCCFGILCVCCLLPCCLRSYVDESNRVAEEWGLSERKDRYENEDNTERQLEDIEREEKEESESFTTTSDTTSSSEDEKI